MSTIEYKRLVCSFCETVKEIEVLEGIEKDNDFFVIETPDTENMIRQRSICPTCKDLIASVVNYELSSIKQPKIKGKKK